MKLYRYFINVIYDGDEWGPPKVDVGMTAYIPFKETHCGYWIKGRFRNGKTVKWVSKTGKKRFAYDDQKLALNSFKKRTNKWRAIASSQVRNCDIALNIARFKEEELKKI